MTFVHADSYGHICILPNATNATKMAFPVIEAEEGRLFDSDDPEDVARWLREDEDA